jgi:hypothetical protein
LAAARPDAFISDLAQSLNNLANRLRALGRREVALATAEEAVRLYRVLAAARPDAFTADLARFLWVLSGLQADTGAQDAGMVTLAEAVKRLIPVFDVYPAAIHDLMTGLVQSYLQRCDQAGSGPDAALLQPVVVVLQRLNETG